MFDSVSLNFCKTSIQLRNNDKMFGYHLLLNFFALNFLNFFMYFIYLICYFCDNLILFLSFLYGLFLDILITCKVRRIPPVLIFYAIIILMDFYLSLNLFFGLQLAEDRFLAYYHSDNIINFITITNIFKASFLAFYSPPDNYIPVRQKVRKIESQSIFMILYIIVLFLVLFGVRGEIIYLSQNAYQTYIKNLEEASGLSEYLIILFVILWLFETKKYQRYLMFFLFVIMSIKLFLYGFRVVLAMYVFLFYIIYLDKVYKFWKIAFFSFLLYIFLSIFGLLKETGSLIVLIQNVSLYNILLSAREEFVLSHFTGVITSSLVILEEMDLTDSILSFFGFLLNIFLPSRFVIDILPQGIIPYFIHTYKTSIPGGLFFPVSSYIWFNIFGPMLISLYISYLFRAAISYHKSNFIYLWFILVFSTMPRWFFYTQTDYLFRFVFYFFLVYMLLIYLKKSKWKSKS